MIRCSELRCCCSSSWSLNKKLTFRKLDLFPSSGEGRREGCLLWWVPLTELFAVTGNIRFPKRCDWLTDWLIMMGWDYVSELLPPTGLFFITQEICEHGGPRWWRCRLLITTDSSTRALWQSYRQRHLGRVGGMDEALDEDEEWTRILSISIWNISKSL
jgi:hypothetical protein